VGIGQRGELAHLLGPFDQRMKEREARERERERERRRNRERGRKRRKGNRE